MSEPFAIEVEDLHKVYREGLFSRSRFAALKGVTLRVPEGQIFGLLGPNGAGKTTLVKILLGIISKTSGRASMLGLPAGSLQSRRKVGYLPEHLRMSAHLTPYSALEVFGSLAGLGSSSIRNHRDRLLELVGLKDWKRERIRKFSKGMLQRLGLAQALLSQPKLLFLDEPTDGLDPRARAEMREIIRKLSADGVTIFLNSHLLQEVELICQQVAILDRGELKYCGSVDGAARQAGMQGSTSSEGEGWLIELEVHAPQGLQLPGLTTANHSGNTDFAAAEGLQVLGEGRFRIRTTVQCQDQVDLLIDQIRQQSASLLSLKRHASSLEDAFLALVE